MALIRFTTCLAAALAAGGWAYFGGGYPLSEEAPTTPLLTVDLLKPALSSVSDTPAQNQAGGWLHSAWQTIASSSGWLVVLLFCVALWVLLKFFLPRHRNTKPEEVPGSSKFKSEFRDRRSELRRALTQNKSAFWALVAFSAICNILMLTGAMFMLEVYDRVLPSRSVETLIALVIIAAGLFLAQGFFDVLRGRILSRISAMLDQTLNHKVFDTVIQKPGTSPVTDRLASIRDFDTLRSVISGRGLTAFLDLPWLPFYLAIIYAFHPALGHTALAGAIILVTFTICTEVMSKRATLNVSEIAGRRSAFAESSRRNSEIINALGMRFAMRDRWIKMNAVHLDYQQQLADVTGDFGTSSRVMRMMLQSAVLAVGAYLVLGGQASAGIIIAGSILSSRALAPLDLAIANWKSYNIALQSWKRLNNSLEANRETDVPMPLPAPQQQLDVDNVSVVAPGQEIAILRRVSFSLTRGQSVGVIGPSASGKTTLAKTLVGYWPPAGGRVQLDGAALSQWDPDILGTHIGYLPQEIELFPGTIAENISRFQIDADPAAVTEAARIAGVDKLITDFPDGYDTEIGEHMRMLSAGQKQRIALARAVYGNPFLIVLDEPNSNLDADGDAALGRAILELKERGSIVVVIAHRPTVLAGLDMVLAMKQGQVVEFGGRDDVLKKVLRPVAPPNQNKMMPVAGKSPSRE